MSDKSRFPGCFKFGCFGCLALFALGVGLLLLLGAIQLTMDEHDPAPEDRQVSHPLPEAPELAAYAGTDQPEMPEIFPLPAEAEPPGIQTAGKIVLDLRMGEFTIRPGPSDEPIRVEADYDANAFDLVEEFTEKDDGTWTYDVKFGGRGGFLGMLLRGGGNSGNNRVDITIPRGRPVEIVGKIGMGESETDLGGLWVRRVDLDFSAGDHFVEFREPLAFPMEEFLLDGSMGNLEVRTLGEASPKTVDVEHSMGELLVDLEGEWRTDSAVEVDHSMGQCRVWLPQTARINIERASVGMGEKNIDLREESDLPEDAPLLKLDVSAGMGELRIEQ